MDRFAVIFVVAIFSAQAPASSPARFLRGELPMAPPLMVSGGQVFLEAMVSTDGGVESIDLLRVTPPFTDAVVTAVRRWRFAPAQRESVAVPQRVFVAALLAPPILQGGPTLGQPPQDLAPAHIDVPAPTATTPLVYPARATGWGTVLVEVIVDRPGPPAETRVVVSSPGFDDAALAAVRAWTFLAAQGERGVVIRRAYVICVFQTPVLTGF